MCQQTQRNIELQAWMVVLQVAKFVEEVAFAI